MDKQQYKHIMEQIQMPDACEQNILDAVRCGGKSNQLIKKRVTWRKRTVIAIAAAACVSVVSIFSVAAVQHTDMLHLLFPEKEAVNESAIAIDTGIENFTYTGFDGVKLTPVGVVADAKQLHIFIYLSSDSVKVDEDYINYLNPHVTGGSDDILINGESGWSEERTDGIPRLKEFGFHVYETETSDGYTVDFSYEFEEALTESTLHIETALENTEYLEFMEETVTSTTDIGTLSYDINIDQIPSRTVELDNMPLTSKRFSARLVQVDIHAFGLDIYYSGSFQGWLSETLAESDLSYYDLKLVMQDGTAVAISPHGGTWCADEQYHSFGYLFDEPINPEDAAYIACGDIEIPLS